jgi:TPR repeat protein
MRDLSVELLLAAALICGAAAPAWADFDDGVAALRAGDYATALKEWRPLAEQGNAVAQNNLGVTYDNGYGVPAQNPDGPLDLCTCATCGTPIMLDDKESRIRVIVPNLMGYNPDSLSATYHAFYDSASGAPAPGDGRPVHEGLRPDFVWPGSA